MPPKKKILKFDNFSSNQYSGMPFGIDLYTVPEKLVYNNKYVDTFTKKGNIRRIKGVPAINLLAKETKATKDYIFSNIKNIEKAVKFFKEFDDVYLPVEKKLGELKESLKDYTKSKTYNKLKEEAHTILQKYFDSEYNTWNTTTLKGKYLNNIFKITENENISLQYQTYDLFNSIYYVFRDKYILNGGAYKWGIDINLDDKKVIYNNKSINPITDKGTIKTRQKNKAINFTKTNSLNYFKKQYDYSRPIQYQNIYDFKGKLKLINIVVDEFNKNIKMGDALQEKKTELHIQFKNLENSDKPTKKKEGEIWRKEYDNLKQQLKDVDNEIDDNKKILYNFFQIEYTSPKYNILENHLGNIIGHLFKFKSIYGHEDLIFNLFKKKYMSGEKKKIDNIKKVKQITVIVPQKKLISLKEKTTDAIKDIKNILNDKDIKITIDNATSKLVLDNFFRDEKSNLLTQLKKTKKYKDIDNKYISDQIDIIINEMTQNKYREFETKKELKEVKPEPKPKPKPEPKKKLTPDLSPNEINLLKVIEESLNHNNVLMTIEHGTTKSFINNYLNDLKKDFLKVAKKYKGLNFKIIGKKIDEYIDTLTQKRFKEIDDFEKSKPKKETKPFVMPEMKSIVYNSKGDVISSNPYLKSKSNPNNLMKGVYINADIKKDEKTEDLINCYDTTFYNFLERLSGGEKNETVKVDVNLREKIQILINASDTSDFYPTPKKGLDLIIKNMKGYDFDFNILEPSCGIGMIITRLIQEKEKHNLRIKKIKGVEINKYMFNLVSKEINPKCAEIINDDFLNFNALLPDCNCIVMNPPFSKFQYINHILHAIFLLYKSKTDKYNKNKLLIFVCPELQLKDGLLKLNKPQIDLLIKNFGKTMVNDYIENQSFDFMSLEKIGIIDNFTRFSLKAYDYNHEYIKAEKLKVKASIYSFFI